jgi:hypothetical protein
MKATRKSLLLLTTGAALLLTGFSYLIRSYPEAPLQLRPIVASLAVIEMPAAFAGIAVSGNPHQPHPVAFCLVLFITYWLIMGVGVWLAHSALGHWRREGS